jgi:hypothetical protein
VQLSLKPNPQPLPYKGRGVRIKASLPVGERFGEGFQESITKNPIYPDINEDL